MRYAHGHCGYPVARVEGDLTGMTSTRAPARSATAAVVLSFVWPGLGHAYQRRYRGALIYALPMLLVVGYVAIALAQRGLQGMALDLFDPSFSQTVLVLGVLLGLWRLAAMADCWLFARHAGSRTRLASGLLAVLGLVVVAAHGYAGYLSWSFYDAGSQIFVGSAGGDLPFPELEPSPSTDFDPSPDSTEAAETPTPGSSRISMLLMGIDSTATRTHALTDTLLVVSVDPDTKTGAMVSIPRDVGKVPLYFGGTYGAKINSLLSYVRRHPDDFPDGPTTTVRKEVGHLIGVPVPYYAYVDLAGFVKLVDLVDGVTIVNPRAINDPRYGGWTDGRPVGFKLSEGRHNLDSQEALAYVRSRYGAGDSDFSRARRQQQLLLALQKKLTTPEMLPRLPSILSAAGKTIKTNFPAARLSEVLDLATQVTQDDVERVVLGPGYTTKSSNPAVYMLVPDMKKFAKESIKLFGEDSRYWKPPASASPSPSPSASP
jgi:polyisoprenyl-teichoic acid--peptidoglycan teichoic acid transferase